MSDDAFLEDVIKLETDLPLKYGSEEKGSRFCRIYIYRIMNPSPQIRISIKRIRECIYFQILQNSIDKIYKLFIEQTVSSDPSWQIHSFGSTQALFSWFGQLQ